jgi:hypothetical protein
MSRRKGILLVIALCLPLLGFVGTSGVKTGQPPIILAHYAASKIKPGATWRVFLHARDVDGDMKDITAMLLEPGNVISPVSFTRIKEVKDRAEFRGYLYLNIPRSASLIGRKFFIKVQVRDQETNRSEAVKIPLTFANVPKEDIPEKWQTAANHSLGGIMIDFGESNDWRSVY